METSATSSSTSSSATSSSTTDAFADLSMDTFLNLLVTELQNQDPLDPMDNSEILQQVTQISEIDSTQHLTETLESVLMGQNLVTASNLIGQTVAALSSDAAQITGEVDRVTLEDGVATLHIGEHTVALENVSEILGVATEETTTS